MRYTLTVRKQQARQSPTVCELVVRIRTRSANLGPPAYRTHNRKVMLTGNILR